jgi:hypothetical protein
MYGRRGRVERRKRVCVVVIQKRREGECVCDNKTNMTERKKKRGSRTSTLKRGRKEEGQKRKIRGGAT